MRGAWLVAVAALLSGCFHQEPAAPPPPGDGGNPEPIQLDYYLKPGHELSDKAPSASAPVREPAYPTANAYANEDVETWTGPAPGALVVERARLELYYAVDAPTVSGNRNETDPTSARHFVVWIGAQGVYPTLVTVWGPAVLVPNTLYSALLDVPLPVGGWVVLENETVELLAAPLMVNGSPSIVNYLVDHPSTPSRLQLWARPDAAERPPRRTLRENVESYAVPANSGLFTGALGGVADTVTRTLDVAPNQTFLGVEVRWRSTAAGKSDLDLLLRGPDGTSVAASTTPYQNETLRLFRENLDAIGSGRYAAEVTVYSGALTSFDVVVLRPANEHG